MNNNVALITGANTGIGRVTAVELARRGYQLFLACRSQERTEPVLREIRSRYGASSAQWLPLDLGDFESVRTCARMFLDTGLPLHLLINNAGLAGARGITKSGFELAFGVNHMGHFLLTDLLLDKLKQSAPARVITVASRAHKRIGGIQWDRLQRPTASFLGMRDYCVSKLANVLFSAELARRLEGTGVAAVSLHPGVIASDLWRNVAWPLRFLNQTRLVSVEEGAKTTLHCAIAPEIASLSGGYFSDSAPISPSHAAQDALLARTLWDRSAEWIAKSTDGGT